HLGLLQAQGVQLAQRLEVNQAGVADRCLAQVEALELGQAFELSQVRVGQRCIPQIELFDARQAFEACAAYLRALHCEPDEFVQALQVNQSLIRDRHVGKRQVPQVGHVFEVHQSGIGNLATAQS